MAFHILTRFHDEDKDPHLQSHPSTETAFWLPWVTNLTQSRIEPWLGGFYNTEVHYYIIVFIRILIEKCWMQRVC